ncbi:MAG: VOC family protein [Dehalococcoidia bacterium]
MAVKPIPDGYQSITPSLVVKDAARLVTFLTEAFGAKERMRMPTPDGKIAHTELEIGNSVVMLADASNEFPAQTGALHLYVENVDAVWDRAIKAGGKQQRPVENQFYGDRSGMLIDPAGNQWSVSQHVEDVSDQEVEKRMKAMAPA